MPPLISVVMSAYNEEEYIGDAITSILDQTYDDFEFIIIDDASTDRTKEIIESFDDRRIAVLENEENLGLTKSLNIGLNVAQGKLIARMDANDISARTRFEKQAAVFETQSDVDLVWTGAVYITKTGECLCPNLAPPFQEAIDLLKSCPTDLPVGRNHVNHVTVMFRKATVLRLGGYSEKYKWGQDGNLWCRMLKSGAEFYFLEEPLMSIRIVPDSVTARRSRRSKLNENDYYSSLCLANRHYTNALKYMYMMPWNLRKIKRFMGILYRFLLK